MDESKEKPQTIGRRHAPNHVFPESDIVNMTADDGSVIQPLLKTGDTLFPLTPIERGYSPDPRTHFPAIRDMTINEDDVCLCAHPKTGTHWLWEVTMMLLKGKAEYDTSPKEMTMMEFTKLENLEKAARPRVLNTHLAVQFLPKQLLENKGKIIFIQRNPKDTVVSFYNHLCKIMKPLQGQWPVYLRNFLQGFSSFGPWPTYTKGFEKLIKENPDLNILPMYFEDMKRDPVGEIKKVAKFLGSDVSDSIIEDIADKCSFQNLKKADMEVKKSLKVMDPGAMYRKGEVGDWKNWLTVAQNEMFDDMLEKEMGDCTFKYTYTLETDK